MATLPKKVLRIKDGQTLAEAIGVILGFIAGGILSILLGAWIIHAILTGVSLGQLTYLQVVGLLAIWEIVKPRPN